jgi:hypothetical protein
MDNPGDVEIDLEAFGLRGLREHDSDPPFEELDLEFFGQGDEKVRQPEK